MLISIYRFNPEADTKPIMQDIEVDVPLGTDLMVLDAQALAKEKDSTIAAPKPPSKVPSSIVTTFPIRLANGFIND